MELILISERIPRQGTHLEGTTLHEFHTESDAFIYKGTRSGFGFRLCLNAECQHQEQDSGCRPRCHKGS